MKAYSISFTEKGQAIQTKISEIFNGQGIETKEYFKGVKTFTGEAFQNSEIIVFVGAMGIAVRSIAPYIKSKDNDPAVIVVDELGQYVIPVLSGHIGGANKNAVILAERLDAVPVITTATDVNEKLAIDNWAVENNFSILDIGKIKYISSAVLEDSKIALVADNKNQYIANKSKLLSKAYSNFVNYDIHQTDQITEQNVIVISESCSQIKNKNTFNLCPKNIFIGMGCRRDKDVSEFEEFFLEILNEHTISLKQINSISSIDLKKDEAAFWNISKKYNLKLNFYASTQLEEAEKYTKYSFSESQLVKNTTGVGNVCERAAVLAAGIDSNETKIPFEFIKHKYSKNGMTIAIVKYL